MDIMDEILAAHYNLLRAGHSASDLWLLVDHETFNQMRRDFTTGAVDDMTFCNAPVIVARNISGYRWLRTPWQRKTPAGSEGRHDDPRDDHHA